MYNYESPCLQIVHWQTEEIITRSPDFFADDMGCWDLNWFAQDNE